MLSRIQDRDHGRHIACDLPACSRGARGGGMTYLCIHPILAYIKRGWDIKKTDILSSLDDKAKPVYLKVFLNIADGDASVAFEKLYVRRYGRYRLTVPAILLVLVLYPISLLVAETAVARLSVGATPLGAFAGTSFLLLPGTALAAISGAYTWIVYSLISASSQYNLQPPAVLSAILRMVVAAPLGYAVAYVATPGLQPFVAFAIGAFPLDTVQTVLQRIANKQLNLDIGTDSKTKQVTQLDGIDLPTADRIQTADITTIAQLAYCDPVQLSMRTNLSFDFVIDIVAQALAWLYFEQRMIKIRPLSLRGALEIRYLCAALASGEAAAKEAAQKTLVAAASAAGIDPDGFRSACQQVADDPYTEFLNEVWK
jgi:hypothetical protein